MIKAASTESTIKLKIVLEMGNCSFTEIIYLMMVALKIHLLKARLT